MLLHVESPAGREMLAEAGKPTDSVEGSQRLLAAATSPEMAMPQDEARALLASVAETPAIPNRVSITHTLYKGRFAGDLGVQAIGFDASASGQSLTVVQDTYRAVRQERGRVAVYRGGSVRIAVTAFDLQADAKLSLPMIAASAEIAGTRAYYRFDVIGLKDFTHIAENLPTVGSFDIEAYASLIKAANSCTKLLLTQDLEPDDLFVEPLAPDPAGMANTLVNALRQVAAGNDPSISDVTAADDYHDWIIEMVSQGAAESPDPRDWAERILRQQWDKLRQDYGH